MGQKRLPIEAVGILLPKTHRGSWIVELPNRSKYPQDSFSFRISDLKFVLAEWLKLHPDAGVDEISIFHTHPRGGVGPSRVDMQGKIEGSRNLVVSITPEGPVPSWY